MWIDQLVNCPKCQMAGPFRMFGTKALIHLDRPLPLDNQVILTCPFGTHTFALRRIRKHFTEAEWQQIVGMVEKEKAEWLP